VDALDRAHGRVGVQRFEYLSGTEADMRFYFEWFKDNPQVLAVELHGHLVTVVERFDRLLDLLPDLDPAAARGYCGAAPTGGTAGDSRRSGRGRPMTLKDRVRATALALQDALIVSPQPPDLDLGGMSDEDAISA
jgi:hypothetical protein